MKNNTVDKDFHTKFTAHSEALAFLLDTEGGRDLFFRFLSRELRLMEVMLAIENNERSSIEKVAKSDDDKNDKEKDDEEGFFKRLKRLTRKYGKGVLKKFLDKIFDKLNDLIKSYVGGSQTTTLFSPDTQNLDEYK